MAHMNIMDTSIGLAIFALVFAWAVWREKRIKPGEPPLIPPTFIQFIALLGILVFAAHMLALATGVEWQSPFRPSI